MKATMQLPDGYRLLREIDLEKNKKQAGIVNGLSLIVAALVLVPMVLCAPEGAAFVRGLSGLLMLVGGMFLYVALHEAVHGVCFWAFSGEKPRFGWKSVYAYAASDAYYSKWPYLSIALAPVVFWGAVLAVLAAILPADWYWMVQMIQLINLSGAAGDLYVTWLLCRMPADILIQDAGVAMQVFGRADG